MEKSHKLITNLWFDNQAEEAAEFYTSIFKNSRIGHMNRYSDAGFEYTGKSSGSVMTVEFELNGQRFVALNGGPQFKFTEAISFVITCETQEEIDYYWNRLTEGGDPAAQQCGWCKDKFGISWQVVPAALSSMLADSDPNSAKRVFEAMFPMKKLDIAVLERASKKQ